MKVLGWDIGGVNTKVAHVVDGRLIAAVHRPFELQRAPHRLVPLLQELADRLDGDRSVAHALTMTAELSQMFRTKREGVHFVLDAMTAAFPGAVVRVFGVDGQFHTPQEARSHPMLVAAANWVATATMVAAHHPDALLIDIGTTTADIIPIAGGRVVAQGCTDPARLASGELVYTGVVRTPVEAIATHVPVGGVATGVAAEGFALSGDVHVWRGDLADVDYTAPTPDGRLATRTFVGERLARAVCADRELLDEEGVSEVADALAGAQTQQVASAIARVWARHPSLRHAVVTGMGAFLGEAAAHAAGVPAVPLSADIGADGARCAPASAVALLLGLTDVRLVSGSHEKATPECTVEMPATGVGPQKGVVDLVIKIGGGLLADPVAFDAVLRVLGLQLSRRRALIVPGGGPFADAVRAVDRQLPLDDRVAHWMAVQAMDLYAELIASRLSGAIRVDGLESIRDACAAGRLPVLAPHRWLREVDPLPHSWAVTSDSIAAWIGRTLGARRLVLIKPPGARGERLTDDYFERAVSPDLSVVVIAADRMAELGSLLAGAANAADG